MKQTSVWTIVCMLGVGAVCAAQDQVIKARGALASKDTATALMALQEALKQGQRPAETNYLLGAIWYNRGKLDQAIPHLQASVNKDDENAEALSLLGLSLAEKHDLAGALGYLKRAEKFGKKNPVVLTALGKAFLSVDSTDAAIQRLLLAKEYDSTNPALYVMLGDAFLKQNVAPMAVSNYREALRIRPNDLATRLKVAKIFEDQRNYNEAVKEYDELLGVDSTNTAAMLAKGKILVRAKQEKRAVGPLLRFTQLMPKSVEGSQYYARALAGTDYTAETAKEAERSIKLDSSEADIWRIWAEALVDMKNYPGALKAYEGLKRRKALGNQDMAKYGSALVGVGREEEALRALLEAVKADSANCEPYYSLGTIYMKKQDWVQAAGMFEKRIGCDARSLGAYLNAALCYMQPAARNLPRARELLMKVIEVKPDFLLGRLWLGRYYSMVDSLELAKLQYDEVLRQAAQSNGKYKKEEGEAHYMTGSYFFATKQYGRSVESFRKASGMSYDNSGMQLTWGQALLQLLDKDKAQSENDALVADAIAHFRKSVAMDQGSAAGHLWLAQGLILARKEGDPRNKELVEEACGEFRKVLRIDPGNADAKKGMERVGCPGTGK